MLPWNSFQDNEMEMNMTDEKCIYCDATEEIRPYGPNGSWVCIGCVTSDPEIEREAEKNFLAAMDSAGGVSVINGDKYGVRPYSKKQLH